MTIGYRAFSGCHSLERITFPTISNRLSIIIQAGQYPSIEAKIDEVRGVIERRGSDLFVDAEAMKELDQWNTLLLISIGIQSKKVVIKLSVGSGTTKSMRLLLYLNWHCGKQTWIEQVT